VNKNLTLNYFSPHQEKITLSRTTSMDVTGQIQAGIFTKDFEVRRSRCAFRIRCHVLGRDFTVLLIGSLTSCNNSSISLIFLPEVSPQLNKSSTNMGLDRVFGHFPKSLKSI